MTISKLLEGPSSFTHSCYFDQTISSLAAFAFLISHPAPSTVQYACLISSQSELALVYDYVCFFG